MSEGGIGAAHLLQILGPALLGDGDPPAPLGRRQRASAAGISRAKTRAPWLPPSTRRRSVPSRAARIGLLAEGGDRRAHRIAGEARRSALPERRGLGEGGGDRRGALGGQQAVGAAEHGVLLVQHGRKAGALARPASSAPRHSRRSRRRAAGRRRHHEPARLEIAAQKLRDALGAAAAGCRRQARPP